jgi:hypothetical protein
LRKLAQLLVHVSDPVRETCSVIRVSKC